MTRRKEPFSNVEEVKILIAAVPLSFLKERGRGEVFLETDKDDGEYFDLIQ